MQIVSLVDNLHEMSKPVFWKNKKIISLCHLLKLGWLGEAKVSCILYHQGVQLRLAYSWARPAILAAGKGRGGNVFISSVVFHFCSFCTFSPVSLFHLLYYLFYLSFPFLWETIQADPQELACCLNPNTINHLLKISLSMLSIKDKCSVC